MNRSLPLLDVPEQLVVAHALRTCAKHHKVRPVALLDNVLSAIRISTWIGPARQAPLKYDHMLYVIRRLQDYGIRFDRHGYTCSWNPDGYIRVLDENLRELAELLPEPLPMQAAQ